MLLLYICVSPCVKTYFKSNMYNHRVWCKVRRSGSTYATDSETSSNLASPDTAGRQSPARSPSMTPKRRFDLRPLKDVIGFTQQLDSLLSPEEPVHKWLPPPVLPSTNEAEPKTPTTCFLPKTAPRLLKTRATLNRR